MAGEKAGKGLPWLLVALISTDPTAHAYEQADPRKEFRRRAWTREQGLPSDHIHAILQTKDGYLWIGTRFGLARFDGLGFRVFNRANTPAMINEECASLAEDQQGNLWIATQDGLLRRDREDGSFKRLTSEDGLLENRVSLLLITSTGDLWAAHGTRGLTRFHAGGTSRFPSQDGAPLNEASALAEDRQGRLWLGGASLLCFDTQTGSFARQAPSPDLYWDWTSDLQVDPYGIMWILFCNSTTREGGLHRYEADTLTLAFSERISNDSRRLFVTPDRAGGLWLPAGSQGLARFHHGRLRRYTVDHGPKPDYVLCLFQDREGSVWFGTEYGGLHCWQPKGVLTYSTQDGLVQDNVWALCEARDGSVWIGTDGGVSRFCEGTFTNYTEADGLVKNTVRSIVEDKSGRIWIGTGAGLGCLHKGQFSAYEFPGEWFSTKVRCLQVGRDGTLWVGTAKALHRARLPDFAERESRSGSDGASVLRQSEILTYNTGNGLVNDDVRAVLEDRAGRIWIGTHGGGLFRLFDGQWSLFTTTNGLSSNYAWALYEDADGAVWIGTERGLNRFHDEGFEVFTTRQGLFDDRINSILEDDRGHLWLGADRGIYRVRKQELLEVASGRVRAVSCIHYHEADGLLVAETNGQKSNPNALKGRDGRLWYSTPRGVVVIDPRRRPDIEVAPPVVIEQVIADDEIVWGDGIESAGQGRKSQVPAGARRSASTTLPTCSAASQTRAQSRVERGAPSASKLRLAPGRARLLEVRYTANTFVAPEQAQFRYRLDGYDKDWREAGMRRLAHYTNLRPGHYVFRVTACNHHKVWNETGASLAFYLAPHFYQTWWFRSGCVLAALLAGAAVFRWRAAELRRIHRLEKQAALAAERARLTKDLHDGLGANLSQLVLLADLAKEDAPEKATLGAREISRSAHEVLHSLKEFLWTVHPADATLDGLLAQLGQITEDFLRPIGIRVRFDLPLDLSSHPFPAKTREGLCFIFKEALNNIAKHARAHEVWIRAQVSGTALQLVIEDDGQGFDTALPAAARHLSPKSGRGLGHIRSRVADLGGKVDVRSQIGRGTTIALHIPLPSPKTNLEHEPERSHPPRPCR